MSLKKAQRFEVPSDPHPDVPVFHPSKDPIDAPTEKIRKALEDLSHAINEYWGEAEEVAEGEEVNPKEWKNNKRLDFYIIHNAKSPGTHQTEEIEPGIEGMGVRDH